MKTKLFCTALILLTGFAEVTQARETPKLNNFCVHSNFADSIKVHSITFRKNNVRLFPNPSSTGVLTITSNSSEKLFFYVFDLEGTLVHRISLDGRAKKTITDLKKGTYTYDVFKNDESIEQGKIIVK